MILRLCRAVAAANEVNADLSRRRSTVSTSSRYQPGYSADGAVQVIERLQRIGQAMHCVAVNIQRGPRQSHTLLVFEFPPSLDALYLQFLFTHISFSLNNVTVTHIICACSSQFLKHWGFKIIIKCFPINEYI